MDKANLNNVSLVSTQWQMQCKQRRAENKTPPNNNKNCNIGQLQAFLFLDKICEKQNCSN